MRITEKLALSGRMTSVIAHEINNPLEAITNLMYLIRGELPKTDSSTALEYITMAESELERISGITKQTLRWSRENTLLSESTSASVIFDEVQRLFAERSGTARSPSKFWGDTHLKLHGVIGQIRQVIANLLSNALDASPIGNSVTIETSLAGNFVEIIIRDRGRGMSEDVVRNLFQPFVSTKGDLGNGLGLYISKEIVERHGGTIVLDSRLGIGTTAKVSLPSLAA